MKVLIVGAGVIGTVYGAHLALAGNTVSVLSHGSRTGEVAAGGLSARDVLRGDVACAATAVVPDASGDYDVVLVAVRRDQLAAACAGLTALTALQKTSDPRLATLEAALRDRGFPVQRVTGMDGWLICHAAFIACIAAALFRCGTDPARLASDRATLTLMCQAITEVFAALRASGLAGLPRNLAVLHSPLLKAFAIRYWARTMRSPAGELCFAAHTRHAPDEMRALGQDTAARITTSPALTELLRS